MNDGRTRKVELISSDGEETFLARYSASLVLVSGPEAGNEWRLEGTRSIIGRSSKSTIQLDGQSISSEHAAIELGLTGFGIRDLASTNGLRVNGQSQIGCALSHGDRIELGDFELQYILEERPKKAKSWSLDDQA